MDSESIAYIARNRDNCSGRSVDVLKGQLERQNLIASI